MDATTVVNEFRKRGFITDPRGCVNGRSLYSPELKINVLVSYVGKSKAGVYVIDMVDNGMTWGNGYKKLPRGVEIKFDHVNKTFEQFFNVTFTNRVKKLNKLAAL